MTSLGAHQRAMLALLKGRSPPADDDAHIVALESAPGLALLREFAVWWRALGLEAACPLTVRLLRRLQLFDGLVEAFYREANASPYVERAAGQFLSRVADHNDGLVRAMAAFEAALITVRAGSSQAFAIAWDRNPDSVFRALSDGTALPAVEPGVTYRLHMASALPNLVRCDRLCTTHPEDTDQQ